MLRSRVFFAGLCLTALSGVWVAGCGDDEVVETPVPGKQPPPRPEGELPGDGPGLVLAVSELYLGEDGNDWADIGYDLDGRVSDGTDTTLCKPAGSGNPTQVHKDGNNGIDNAFGNNLLSVITTLIMNPSSEVNTQIQEGAFTILLDLDALGDAPNYTSIHTYLNIGNDLPMPPAFDGNDEWPIVQELLSDPTDPRSTKLQFPNAYVNNNTWVSGDKGDIDLTLSIGGFNLTLAITNAVITMNLADDRSEATDGIIAGVIPVEPFLEELEKIAGAFDPTFCEGSTIESIKDQIRQAADMPSSGEHVAGKVCDAISIGIGFTAGPAKIGPVNPPADPVEDPCAEGAGGSGAGGSGAGGAGAGGAGGGG